MRSLFNPILAQFQRASLQEVGLRFLQFQGRGANRHFGKAFTATILFVADLNTIETTLQQTP